MRNAFDYCLKYFFYSLTSFSGRGQYFRFVATEQQRKFACYVGNPRVRRIYFRNHGNYYEAKPLRDR